MGEATEIRTARLRLRTWDDRHRDAFAAMHMDPEVMADLGGPISREQSDAKLDRYIETYRKHGTSRWAVEDFDGRFLGYAGVMARPDAGHPFGFHHEIGWRFNRSAWRHGYATESASAALEHAVRVSGLDTIYAYAIAANTRSHAVMNRLGLIRRDDLDFSLPDSNGRISPAMVWLVDNTRYH
ncbi:GNAT family N-acetyltransferase [Hoeflea sp.]|uniref:GNAT family N-acetyltransferase n=1 Tax=Hoeflea sp. TaxID=1940281 RepID=UPI003B52E57E